jgi:mycothione reductase
MATTCDLLVIGSGAGAKVALAGARLGLNTVLIESGPAGGTCLNRGCIPSKMLIFPALLAERVREAGIINVRGGEAARADLPALAARIDSEIGAHSESLRRLYTSTPNLHYVQARARFTAPRTLEAGGETFSAGRVVLAPGAEPRIPDIPGLAATPYMTSTGLLRNAAVPRRLAVVGGGYIAAELGHAYGALGAEVVFIVRSVFLKHEDPDVAAAVEESFKKRYRMLTGYKPAAVVHGPDGFAISCEGPAGARETVRADALLVAAGITPCTAGLGLELAGIACDAKGYIQTDSELRTTAEGVWALGDGIGRDAFRHTANFEAEYLERTLLNGEGGGPLDYGPVPHAVFTRPEAAGVGLAEPAARAAGHELVIARSDYADATNASLARGLEEGFVKIIAERGTGRVLGAHAVGEEAATLAHLFIVLMKKRGTLRDLRDLIFIHPALPEVVRDAVRRLAAEEIGA